MEAYICWYGTDKIGLIQNRIDHMSVTSCDLPVTNRDLASAVASECIQVVLFENFGCINKK